MRTILALGYFDSLHLGHLRIIERAKIMAKSLNARVEVVTFDDNYLNLIKKMPAVYSIEERRQILKQNGVDNLVVLKTDQGFYNLSGEGFFYLFINTDVVGIVCGADYGFGKNRSSDSNDLQNLCRARGIACEIVDILKLNDKKISSSAIRIALKDGNMPLVSELLGRNYSITAKVIRGEGRGQGLGFPTVNIELDITKKQIPMDGVYKSLVTIDDKCYRSLTNVGARPTFNSYDTTVETYIVDFDRSIYGKTIKIEFLERLRDVIRFDSVVKLSEQIKKDLELL